MNANEIINDDMTLEEKLKAIDDATAKVQAEHKKKMPNAAPIDPASLTICDGCE